MVWTSRAPIHSSECVVHTSWAPIHSPEYVVHTSRAPIDSPECMARTSQGSHTFIRVWGHKLLEVWVPLPGGHEFKWGFQTFTIAGGSIGFTGDYPLDKNEDNARLLVLSCMEGSLLEKASAHKGPALLAVTVQRKLRSSCEEQRAGYFRVKG